jgi:hypothetical protein
MVALEDLPTTASAADAAEPSVAAHRAAMTSRRVKGLFLVQIMVASFHGPR